MRTAPEVIAWLLAGLVDEVNLDHDLGDAGSSAKGRTSSTGSTSRS
jgi:hypothetical protein